MLREGKSDGSRTKRLDVAPPWKICSEDVEKVVWYVVRPSNE
jgi:hypothetical protein